MVETRCKGKAGVSLRKSAVLNDVVLRLTRSFHAVLLRCLKISQHRLVCVLPYSWPLHSTLCIPTYNYVDDKAPLNKPHNRYSVWCSMNKKLIACKASSTQSLPLKLWHMLFYGNLFWVLLHKAQKAVGTLVRLVWEVAFLRQKWTVMRHRNRSWTCWYFTLILFVSGTEEPLMQVL